VSLWFIIFRGFDMPIDVFMTQLSPTMTEGKIARWLKKEGD